MRELGYVTVPLGWVNRNELPEYIDHVHPSFGALYSCTEGCDLIKDVPIHANLTDRLNLGIDSG